MSQPNTTSVPDFKIRVIDEAHCRAIQEELFKRGVKWITGDEKARVYKEFAYLFVRDNRLSWTAPNEHYFINQKEEEHTFSNGKFSFDKEEAKPDVDDFAEPPTLQSKKEWQKDRLMDVLKEMTRLVEQADYDTVYDLLTEEAAPLVNDLKWK